MVGDSLKALVLQHDGTTRSVAIPFGFNFAVFFNMPVPRPVLVFPPKHARLRNGCSIPYLRNLLRRKSVWKIWKGCVQNPVRRIGRIHWMGHRMGHRIGQWNPIGLHGNPIAIPIGHRPCRCFCWWKLCKVPTKWENHMWGNIFSTYKFYMWFALLNKTYRTYRSPSWFQWWWSIQGEYILSYTSPWSFKGFFCPKKNSKAKIVVSPPWN